MWTPEKSQDGYTLTWSGLSYAVQTSKGSKQILSNLNGIIRPGTITAVLGASGAGKSSFLDVLAGRVSPSLVSGQVSVNGRQDIPIRHVSRYCTQEDALFSTLTVFQTLIYAAHFNLRSSTPYKQKVLIVRELLQEFGLEGAENTIIGGPFRKGCSGGQVRRVSVASQVVGMTNGILFLDEMTSGLDSVAANAVVKSIQNLAQKENSTIICTIHQPSSETFELFSHVLLLGQGSTVYFGPRDDALSYFETMGHPIPVRANPSDAYLQLTNTDFGSEEKDRQRVSNLIDAFSKSQQNADILAQIMETQTQSNLLPQTSNTYTNGFLYQTKTLISRAFLNAAKNPLAYWVRIFMYIGMAILMSTVWIRMGTGQNTIQDRLGAIFFSVVFLSFMSVAGIPSFIEERHVFMRECANGLYGVESYLISNLLVTIPFMFLITISFSSIAYWSMGLNGTWEKFNIFWGLLFITLMIAEAQTLFISVLIPVFVAALSVTAFSYGIWLIVQGFFIRKTNLPAFWRYTFHQIDFQKYSYELFVTNEFTDLVLTCECDTCPSYSVNCTFKGEEVLKEYDYEDISYPIWISYLVAIFVAFKILTFVFLKIRTRQH